MAKIILCTWIFLLLNAKKIDCDCEVNKVIFNFVFSKQVIALENEFRLYNKTYINMSKMKFNVSDDIKVNGVKLFDITQLVAGDAYVWSAPQNYQYADINISLDPMTLKINSLEYKGKTYQNPEVIITKANMYTKQQTKFERDSCTQNYSEFKFSPIEQATINNKEDITKEFNDIVIPWINQQLSSKNFYDLVNEYFDVLCSPEAAIRLQSLIISPYSD